MSKADECMLQSMQPWDHHQPHDGEYLVILRKVILERRYSSRKNNRQTYRNVHVFSSDIHISCKSSPEKSYTPAHFAYLFQQTEENDV